MKKVFVLMIIYLCIMSDSKLVSQELGTPVQEEKVKLSGNYYWEEATSIEKAEAQNLAKEFLIKTVLDEYQSKGDLNQIKSILIDGIDYLFYKSGPKFRVTAFVDKNNISEKMESFKEMHSVEVIHTDRYQNEGIDTLIHENSTYGKTNDYIANEPKSYNSVTGEMDTVTKTSDKEMLAKDLNTENDQSTTLDENMITDNIAELENTIMFSSSNSIRENLAMTKNANKLFKKLNGYKIQGKLVFGKKEAFNNPEQCDIVVINSKTEQVSAYLIQKENKVIDLLTNTVISDLTNEFKGMGTIWIQYFKN